MSGPSPGGPEGAPGGIVPVRLPAVAARVFEKRASRFRELAPGHAAEDFLAALAGLAQAQRLACREMPDAVMIRRSSWPISPLNILEWHRGEAWREALGVILAEMRKVPLPGPAQAALTRLSVSPSPVLETFADSLLGGGRDRIDLAAAPFVGAALQVYFTALASRVSVQGLEGVEGGCPVCGSPPVAAVVLGDDKLRYLTCSLCATEWHLPRVMCATCRATAGISYFAVEGDPGVAKAEACAQCRTYLKLFYLESGPRAEPFADDVATLSLDLLVSEEGYSRGGVNLFLLPGADSR